MLLHSKRNPINIFFYLFIASLSLAKVSYTQYCVQETAAYLQSYRELRRQRTQSTLTKCVAIKLQIAAQHSAAVGGWSTKNALRIKRQIKRRINNCADHAPHSPLCVVYTPPKTHERNAAHATTQRLCNQTQACKNE